MNALDLLRSRKTKINISEEFNRLPPTFKMYFSFFETGEEEVVFRTPSFQVNDSESKVQLRWDNSKEKNPWLYEEDRLIYLLSEGELREELIEFGKKIDSWHLQGMIKIGGTHGDVLLLGMNANNQDQIFLYGESTSNDEFPEIADSIFDLFYRLELTDNLDGFNDYGLEGNLVYKNWNEDFWRIRKDQA